MRTVKKIALRFVGEWTDGASRMYLTALIKIMSWRVALALVLSLFISVAQGAQVLLLIPLMQLVGLDVQQGSVGQLAEFVSTAFATVGLRPTLLTVLGTFVVFSTALALITRWQSTFQSKFLMDFVIVLRRRLYRAIARADWLTFSRSRSSDFTHALTTQLERVGEATAAFLLLLTSVTLTIIYVVLALSLSLPMTALVFASGAALSLALIKKKRAARLTGEDMSLATNGLYAAAIEHLAGMKTVKSYGVEERNAVIFSNLAERVNTAFLNAIRNNAAASFWFGVGSTMILSVTIYVALEVLGLSAAGLILLVFLFNRIIPLFSNIQQNHQLFLNALPAFVGVMDMVLRYEASAEPRSERPEEAELRQGVRFENVRFSYDEAPGERPTISDLDLTIEAGKTTAIVGPSGAGKSTIADLALGLIMPSRGRVLVDGAPLGAPRIRSWRSQIGYVAQDTFLFNDTVRSNLLWAHPEADEEEINRALELAAAEEFVQRLPEGLGTILGDRGVRLSGGERQRLALARALLRRPSLLILDEATSALDSENEQRIQHAMEDLHGNVTILVIAHRLTTVRGADVIHVLEQGQLVESGDWESLLERNGRFHALAVAQGIPR